MPSFDLELELQQKGHKIICGVDEVGRGAWAGPVIVGTAIFNSTYLEYKIDDSKLLVEKKREELFRLLMNDLSDFSIGIASHKEIDNYGISEALRIAARRAYNNLLKKPDIILLDGKWNYFEPKIKVKTVVGGDGKITSISAASIIAKVLRDKMLRVSHGIIPQYDFKNNKGYGTKKHKEAIDIHGLSDFHRRSYSINNSWKKIKK